MFGLVLVGLVGSLLLCGVSSATVKNGSSFTPFPGNYCEGNLHPNASVYVGNDSPATCHDICECILCWTQQVKIEYISGWSNLIIMLRALALWHPNVVRWEQAALNTAGLWDQKSISNLFHSIDISRSIIVDSVVFFRTRYQVFVYMLWCTCRQSSWTMAVPSDKIQQDYRQERYRCVGHEIFSQTCDTDIKNSLVHDPLWAKRFWVILLSYAVATTE